MVLSRSLFGGQPRTATVLGDVTEGREPSVVTTRVSTNMKGASPLVSQSKRLSDA